MITTTNASGPLQLSTKSQNEVTNKKPSLGDSDILPHRCDFKHSKYDTDQHASQKAAMKKLAATTVTALLFMSTEIYGGILSNSLAVLADAAH